jgi:hypothetical protein
MFILDRKRMTHYQALLPARCGESILVFYEGAPKNGKTQLDEHEETCPLCEEARRQGVTFPKPYSRIELDEYRKNLIKDTSRKLKLNKIKSIFDDKR